jgi:4-amino-4-deoxy-L-arabinose transferase-like glycosyltransferase
MRLRVESRTRPLLLLLLALLAFRAIAAMTLPLSFDEAYYWRWSQHLAPGYWDHPPLIAFVIRAGTALFGDTSVGVRFGAFLLSLVSTLAVWRAGAILFQSEYDGVLAALFLNLTLMMNVEALVATPDAPAMAFSALFLLALVKVQQTRQGAWWLVAGAVAGFSLLSKYTAPFLGAGALLWLAVVPEQRRWFASLLPYVGMALAVVIFLPNILWNADHAWITFERQFGRAGAGAGFTLRYLGEFLAGQFALASPFILVLALAGFARLVRRGGHRDPLMLVLALVLPATLYFLWHSLQARVEGNWPSFLYPMFALAAVAGMEGTGRAMAMVRKAAIPFALALTGIIYVQALSGFLPLSRDPLMRLLAINYQPVADRVENIRRQAGAGAILTTAYAQTGWLSFYLPSNTPVIQLNERQRWMAEPPPQAWVFERPMLYVTETHRDMAALLNERFAEVRLLTHIARVRNGREFERYAVYRVERPTRPILD